MLIQVEESHQPFGSSLQLDHLCPGLHHRHASLHCGKQHTRQKVINILLFSGRAEVLRVSQQLMGVSIQNTATKMLLWEQTGVLSVTY